MKSISIILIILIDLNRDDLNGRVEQHQNEPETESSDMSYRPSITMSYQTPTDRVQYEKISVPSFQLSLEPNHGANEIVSYRCPGLDLRNLTQ